MVAAAVLVTVCAGIYVNWLYTEEQAAANLTDTLNSDKILSSDTMVLNNADYLSNNIDSNTYLKTRSRWLQNLHSDYVTRLKSLEKDQIILHSGQWISHSEQIINSTGNQELIYFAQEVFKIIRKNIAADLLSYTKPQPAGFHTCIYNKEHSSSLLRYLHENINSRTGVPAFLYIQAAIEAKVIERPPYKIAVAEFPNIGKRANYDSYIGSFRNFRQHQETLKTITDEIKTLLK